MKFHCVSGGRFNISLYIKMAIPTQILAENVQRPPAEWLPEYLRALAKVEEKACKEREVAEWRNYIDLVDRCEEEENNFVGPDFDLDDPIPPALIAVREEFMAETRRLSLALFNPGCPCKYCREEKEHAFLTRKRPPCVAHNLRTVAATLCRST